MSGARSGDRAFVRWSVSSICFLFRVHGRSTEAEGQSSEPLSTFSTDASGGMSDGPTLWPKLSDSQT